MKHDTPALTLKKATLEAWTNILYQQGLIDLEKRTRMIAMINKLNGSPGSNDDHHETVEMDGVKMVS